MSYVLIVGAKSDIAKAIAKQYVKNGFDLYLAAKYKDELDNFSKDLMVRSERNIKLLEINILDRDSHQSFYDQLQEKPIGVICAVGYLGDQHNAEHNFLESKKIIDTNYTGIVSLFNIIANDFEKRKHGFMVAISSVAGDRGRKSNYIYGSAKAGLTAYLSGLRNRLFKTGVHVLTVKPGFVNTKMTRGMNLPSILTAQPDEIATAVFKAVQKKKNTIYIKPIWWLIMKIIKIIPEWKFKRMDI
tara:strand:- start:697 stop:1428 length:732 start_codon:yes stop_codon:yes gene_type:complete